MVGFKLRLVSLQSLLHEKGPSSFFYAILLLGKHFESSTVTSPGDLLQWWEIHPEILKGRAEVKQPCFHSSALDNAQSACVHSTWQFTKCILFIILVHLHYYPGKHIISVLLSPYKKQYGKWSIQAHWGWAQCVSPHSCLGSLTSCPLLFTQHNMDSFSPLFSQLFVSKTWLFLLSLL